MRKSNRRSSAKKEKVIMIASAGFVLAALTMTGIYMRSENAEVEDDGYTLDLAELESSADKYNEIADSGDDGDDMQVADGSLGIELGNQDDAMDYMPLEVGSGLVEIPGLTSGLKDKINEEVDGTGSVTGDVEAKTNTVSAGVDMAAAEGAQAQNAQTASVGDAEAVTEEAVAENVETVPTLQFAENDGLLRPVSGEVLLPFSMDGSIYFSTLNHYKYNPALMLSAEEGTTVTACAEGIVVSVYEDAQIGTAVVMEIGDGYQITYGQLKDLTVNVGDYVNEGQIFASVAAPTKYFSVEGSNLYLKMTADGAPINPEVLFR